VTKSWTTCAMLWTAVSSSSLLVCGLVFCAVDRETASYLGRLRRVVVTYHYIWSEIAEEGHFFSGHALRLMDHGAEEG
jgi:hypothetical protein